MLPSERSFAYTLWQRGHCYEPPLVTTELFKKSFMIRSFLTCNRVDVVTCVSKVFNCLIVNQCDCYWSLKDSYLTYWPWICNRLTVIRDSRFVINGGESVSALGGVANRELRHNLIPLLDFLMSALIATGIFCLSLTVQKLVNFFFWLEFPGWVEFLGFFRF
jgi:hypothetical protein